MKARSTPCESSVADGRKNVFRCKRQSLPFHRHCVFRIKVHRPLTAKCMMLLAAVAFLVRLLGDGDEDGGAGAPRRSHCRCLR